MKKIKLHKVRDARLSKSRVFEMPTIISDLERHESKKEEMGLSSDVDEWDSVDEWEFDT
jgi:hypothetical protein